MRSAVTVCLVSEASQGPFVFHGSLAEGCRQAAELGFDAIELFAPDAASIDKSQLRQLLGHHQLDLAAVGTGAGWLRFQWSLASPDEQIRARACEFIRQLVDLAGEFNAPAIIGSMQGRVDAHSGRTQTLEWLAENLRELSEHAFSRYQTYLLFEPLNRYESNVFNSQTQTAAWLDENGATHVKILADLFHMNIEEPSLSAALLALGPRLGHVHFADSNRHAMGFGHISIGPIITALREVGYQGYLSAEILPKPDAVTAARQTMASFRAI